ncbi:MAG: hemolysin family protein [Bacteroidales bacterium]|jgi:CBS domain containing-hemolysin-like protein|nr:hemolysin family protein [Bacteroidales bacterium]
MIVPLLISALAAIILLRFFALMQTAYIAASKFRFDLGNEQSLNSPVRRLYVCHPQQFVGTAQIGYCFALAILCLCMSLMLADALKTSGAEPLPYLTELFPERWSAALLIAAVATVATIFMTMLLPSLLNNVKPANILDIFAVPFFAFWCLFYPLVKLLLTFAKPHDYGLRQNSSASPTDFLPLREQPDEENEVKLIRNALDFSKVKLREVMAPRPEIEALDINADLQGLRQRFIDTGYSRILLYENNIDNILGYVHQSAIFANPATVRDALTDVMMAPETMSARKLLSRLIQQHRSIAVVIDEFGGTAGIVTIEDILEEIFGEIEDEHDTKDLIDKQIGKNEYILSARMEMDALNEKYHFEFPDDEHYETLAGFILAHYENIPKVNTLITIGRYRFKILKATNTRIDLVNMKILH